jgi:hypothetical protein
MNVYRTSDLHTANALMARRRARVRRTSLLVTERHERRIVRRWVGRRLVSLGHRLANEQPMQPARAR